MVEFCGLIDSAVEQVTVWSADSCQAVVRSNYDKRRTDAKAEDWLCESVVRSTKVRGNHGYVIIFAIRLRK